MNDELLRVFSQSELRRHASTHFSPLLQPGGGVRANLPNPREDTMGKKQGMLSLDHCWLNLTEITPSQ